MSSKKPQRVVRKPKTVFLTSAFVEKINAVEGLAVSPRMKTLLELTKDRPGDERRRMIRAQFAHKTS